MKKKFLLISLMVSLLICILAISASAVTGSTSNEYGNVTYVDGISDGAKEYGTESKAVLKNADGTYTTYPAHYIYNGNTGYNMRLSFTALNNATGENYTSASLIRIEVYENAKLNWTFESCTSLIDVYLPYGVSFHYASFSGCSALEAIDLPQSITSIPVECFNGCVNLKSINIPQTVTSFGNRAFQNCNSLSQIKFPEGYTGIVPQDFRKITTGTSNKVTYIVPKSCTGINSQYSINNCNVEKIIFTGDENSAFIADVTTDYKNGLSLITYQNHCDVYYNGVHNDTDNNPCWLTSCDRCGAENQYCGNESTHSLTSVISYTDYTKLGTKTESCSNENCTHINVVVDSEIAPIFTYLGYSSSYNTGKICVGYSVNQEALNAYGADKLSYGVVAYVPGAEETELEPVVISENKASAIDGAVVAPLSSEYSSFDFIISGFETEEHYSTKLVMSMYIYDGEGVDYICSIDGEAVQLELAQTVVFADHVEE